MWTGTPMIEQTIRHHEIAAQVDDDDVLDTWLASLSEHDFDLILNGLADGRFNAIRAFEVPA